MITYTYECSECKNIIEYEQSIKDDPKKDCPNCGKPTLKRQITNGNFILKGDGWAKDLYSSSTKK